MKTAGNKGNDGGNIQSDIERYLRTNNPGVGLGLLIGAYAIVLLFVVPAALIFILRSGI